MKTIEFDTHFYKKLWTLMVPIMVQNLMLALVAVADAFMLGGLDQNYMSAVSLATQIQFIQNMFLSAATAGLAILGAQYWGKQDIKALDDIFALAIRICGIVSVLFFVACAFFPRYLMLIFTNEPVLIDYGVSYLKIASFSLSVDRFFAVLYSHDEDIRARGYCGGSQLDYSAYKHNAQYHIYLWCIWNREHECEGSGTCLHSYQE
ncbi:MAG: MATE family efflux transporter [Agathobacter rectalis]